MWRQRTGKSGKSREKVSEQGTGKNTEVGYKGKDSKKKDEKAYEILEFPTKKVILTNQDRKKREQYRGWEVSAQQKI